MARSHRIGDPDKAPRGAFSVGRFVLVPVVRDGNTYREVKARGFDTDWVVKLRTIDRCVISASTGDEPWGLLRLERAGVVCGGLYETFATLDDLLAAV